MKYFVFSFFASFFLTISIELSAGSSSDNTHILVETGQKRKEISSKGNPSKRVRVKKHVTFEAGTLFPSAEGLILFAKRGFSQEAVDAASEYDEATGEYTPLMITRGDGFIEMGPVSDSVLKASKRRDLQFEFSSVLPDSEWEYGFAVIERVFGLSQEMSERHPLWNHKDRYPREVLMVMNALRFHFDFISQEAKDIFREHLEELKCSEEMDIKESEYYEFLASHTFFEENLNSDGTQNQRPDLLSPEDTALEKLIKKYELIDRDLKKLREAAENAPSIMKSIIALGIFGDEEKQASLLNSISRIYKNAAAPSVLIGKKEEEVRHIRRFVIALKQSLFRFISVAEQDFSDGYDAKETTVTSSE